MFTRNEVIQKVKSLNFTLGTYAVFGSAVLTAYNIRQARDIDIFVTPALYQKLQQEGWEEKKWDNGESFLAKDVFEAFTGWHNPLYTPNGSKIIQEADLIEGIPFTKLSEILIWKKAKTGEKDTQDVVLLEQFLKTYGRR